MMLFRVTRTVLARWLKGAVVITGAALISACGPSHHATSAPKATNAKDKACLYAAAHDRFIKIGPVSESVNLALTVTGKKVTIVCGGPDDFHFHVTTTAETGHTLPTASITVFPTTQMRSVPIKPIQLIGYLATDNTRIFRVSGPLTAITSLQEQYHP